MSITSWPRGWRFANSAFQSEQARTRARKSNRSMKPRLEALEARLVPATVFWTGAAGDLNWGTPGNWGSGSVPTGNDDA